MAIQQDWKISRRGNKCSHSNIKFADGETFYTCIFDEPASERFLRKDFSENSWSELGGTLKPFSFWKSTCKYPQEEESPGILENESAESMLRRMIEDDEASTENARYILALMLERKKTLFPVGVKETESNRILLYEHRATGDVLIIRDPQLRLDEVEKVQVEVAQLLGPDNSGKHTSESDQEQTNSENSPPEPPSADNEAGAIENSEEKS